eukprot:scaffold29009_cov137-Skeletonema_menzelii.AAC.2
MAQFFDPFASTRSNGGGGEQQSSSSSTNAAETNNPFDIFGSSSASSNNTTNGNAAAANNNNQGMAASFLNPFQQFTSSTQQQQQPAAQQNQSANTTTFWQQSNAAIATAINPASPSSMWKSLGGTTTTTTSSSSLAASSTASNKTSKKHKQVVPYAGPIANLQSNWDPWLHSAAASAASNNNNNNMTYLIVKANQSCIVPNGVESVLKWTKLHKHTNGSGGGKGSSSMDDLTMNLDSSMSLEESGGGNGGGETLFGEYDSSTTASSSNGIGVTNDQSYTTSNASSTGGGNNNKKLGKLFKSGLKKAQASLAHSVTSIAIKADGGKNPDWVCASLHYLGGGNGDAVNRAMLHAIGASGSSGGGAAAVSDVCLSKTEWIPLPPPSSFGGGDFQSEEGGQQQQLSFAVPLCVPDLSFLESTASSCGGGGGGDIAADNGIVLTVRLYLRSGATLLKAAAIKKEYCIGECSLMYSQLGSCGKGGDSNGGQQQYDTMNLQFTNGMLADPSSYTYNLNPDSPPMLNLTTLPRIKFNRPCSIGWSLTDPTPIPPSSAAALRWLNMFQLPLDQVYAYPGAAGAIILATECARESTVTLPIATACAKLFSNAAMQSQQRASMIAAQSRRREAIRSYAIPPELDINRANTIVDMALKDGCMEVNMGVVAFVVNGDNSIGGIHNLTSGTERVPSIRMSVSFQRHDSIFEEGIMAGTVPLLDQSPTIPNEALKARFCPRIMSGVPEKDGFELLHGVPGTKPNGKYVGNVRFEVENTSYANVNDNLIVPSATSAPIEGLLELEPYLDQATSNEGKKMPVLVPAIDANSGKRLGTFVLLLQVRALLDSASSSQTLETLPPASLGLVSVAGLDTLMEGLALAPNLDFDPPSSNSQQPPSATAAEMRRRQVATMGTFLTPRYLQNQADVVRSNATSALCDRYDKYYNSVLSGISPDVAIEDDSHVELFERRTPRPFRPSNSRGDELLAGIGFNVHCQGLSIDVLQNGAIQPAAVHYSVTHGAPADHAAGFGVQGVDESTDSGAESSSGARGGLRRLEMKRVEYAKELDDLISGLIRSAGEHFKMRAQFASARQQAGVKLSRHIPPGVPAIAHYRNKAIECAQRLNSLTWNIAARRANCFSQALGIAVTSYLASLSDGSHASKGYASLWQRHGYLVTFEGLLSAVGKELGMIEDASIAVQMLRKVNIVLVADDGNASLSNSERQRVPVAHSPYVKWVSLTCFHTNGSHSKTQYRLEIGLVPSYYQNRVPEPLKNGAAVRLFPVLFQMGVDIRQWGVNAGRNVSSQIKDKSKGGGLSSSESFGDAQNIPGMNEGVGGLINDGDDDDDGDEVGMADNEIGFQLNVDGFRKLNAYAHSVNPTVAGVSAASSAPPIFDSSEQVQVQNLAPHPLLVPLSESIKASAGKMEHSVLDHAAASCQKLGGGSTIFCKSGKDRTGMQVTFKEAQFIQKFIDRKEAVPSEEIFAKATTLRIYGNRVPICEKNAGEAMYAFNPLQAQFMPAMLKPPPITTQWKKPET